MAHWKLSVIRTGTVNGVRLEKNHVCGNGDYEYL